MKTIDGNNDPTLSASRVMAYSKTSLFMGSLSNLNLYTMPISKKQNKLYNLLLKYMNKITANF